MLLYRFRSADQIDYALDIILNSRLYCADWSQLNDPMEGWFTYQLDDDWYPIAQANVQELVNEKRRRRVCSFSERFTAFPLWAHYAATFNGLAVELEIPETQPGLRKVDYRDGFRMVISGKDFESATLADQVLTSKYRDWAYEHEVRLLHTNEWFPLERGIRRVIVGHRLRPTLVQALQIICDARRIPICRTLISDDGIDVESLPGTLME